MFKERKYVVPFPILPSLLSSILYIHSFIMLLGCALHVAFHGCEQTLGDIGSDFVENAGYNSWAEANNIIILYPQAKDNPLNPKGCWDW